MQGAMTRWIARWIGVGRGIVSYGLGMPGPNTTPMTAVITVTFGYATDIVTTDGP
jgi:hypothetical protein